MKGDLLVVMWHYIVPAKGLFIGDIEIAGEQCSFDRFFRQLKALQKDFFIISLDQLWQIGVANLPEKSVLLTFDDGLRNQYDIVLPVLRELKIPAIFSVLVDPLNEIIPATFKLQLIGGEGAGINLQNLREDIFPQILEKRGLKKHLENIQIPEGLYRVEAPALREIKFICNMRLRPAEKNDVVNEMFNAVFPGLERELCQLMFMVDSDICFLNENGMAIASHGISRHLLFSLSSSELEKELKGSKRILESIIGSFNSISAFTYPSAFSGDERIEAAVKEGGYRFAFAYDGKTTINSPANPFCIHRIHEADLEKFTSF